jgi:hypothetical protein
MINQAEQDISFLPDSIKAQLMQVNRRVVNFNSLRTQTLDLAATDVLVALSQTISSLIGEVSKLQNENTKLKQTN